MEAYNLFLALHTLTLAIAASLRNHFPLAVTLGAYRLTLHRSHEGVLGGCDITAAITAGTRMEGGPVFRTGAFAVGACHESGNLELLFDPVHYILERHLHGDAEVGTSVDPLARSAGGSSETAEAAVTFTTAENVAECRENIFHRHSATETTAKASGAAAESLRTHRMAELVVLRAFLRVAEDIVRLGRLLEFLLGFLVAGILVGMVLDGLLAIGLLYFIGSGVFGDTKHLIVISFFCHSRCELLAYNHFRMAKHFIIDCIALLHRVEDLSFQGLVRNRHGGYCFMAVGVEVAILRIHLPDTVLLHVFLKFLIYEFHSFADSSRIADAFGSLKRPLEIVDNRQQPLERGLGSILYQFRFLSERTFAEIVKLGHKEHILLLLFFELRPEFLHLIPGIILFRRQIDVLRRHFICFRRVGRCGLLRFGHFFGNFLFFLHLVSLFFHIISFRGHITTSPKTIFIFILTHKAVCFYSKFLANIC